MARKNNHRSEASSSAIHFDASTKTVMAEASHENIKEKVLAVREVVPGKSNNEVILVLQYYDYCVERTIQAYLEDGAKEALQEWNFTGSKQPNKKRKNKKKTNSAASGGTNNENTDTVPSPVVTNDATKSETALSTEADTCEDVNHKGPATSTPPVTAEEPSPQQAPAKLPQQFHSKGKDNTEKSHHQHHQHPTNHVHRNPRERTVSEISTGSSVTDVSNSKRPFQGLEKAIKDLHRQTTSLERLRNLLDHEIDRSYRSVKSVFQELQQGLTNREAQLYEEMDRLKKEASEMIEMRHGKAADLRRQVDRAERMTDSEVSELRTEIKHFVSERRHDEEFGRATRFIYDSDHLLAEINKFGEVVPVKSVNTTRRASASSISSSIVSQEGGKAEVDHPHSQEVNELQDRLKSSLKIQTSGPEVLPSQNGSIEKDIIPSRNHRRPGNSQRGRGNRQRGPEFSEVHSDQATSYPRAASSRTERQNSNHSHHNTYSSNYNTSNTGSPGRGGSRHGGNRGRGERGRGAGRGGGQRAQRPPYSGEALKDVDSTSVQGGAISVST